MAPILSLSQDGSVLSPRRTIDPDCLGWDCLSNTAQAGVVITIIACAALGYYLWHKLGNSEDGNSRKSSMAVNLAALARLSCPGTPSDRRQSHRLSGSIYRRSHRFVSSLHRRSLSHPTSLSSIREVRSRQADGSDSSGSPHLHRVQHVESADLANENRQLSVPVIPPPPGPAPILWTAGPTPIFVLPPAYPPTPSNDNHANQARFSLAADHQVPPPPHMVPFQYGPNPIAAFPNGMPPSNYQQGPFPPFQQAFRLPTVESQAGTSHSDAAERPVEKRRRSWFTFMKSAKHPGHGRSISESGASHRQPMSPSEVSDLRLPPMSERGTNRLQRQPSIRIIDPSPSLQRQHSPRPYPRISWRNESSNHHLRDEDNQSDQGEEIHPSELSFPSAGTSMRVHDGIASSEANSSTLARDPHFEEHSPERRRQRSLKRFRNLTREGDSAADDEIGGILSSTTVFQERKRHRHRRRRLYSSWRLAPMPPSPPSSDIQFPSPESQRVRFVEPGRERDGLMERERRRRERTPAPRRVESSGERAPERGRRERSEERTPPIVIHRRRHQSLERSEERTPTHRRRERSRGSSDELSDEDATPPRRRTRSCERDEVQSSRERNRSGNNFLGRLRALRMEMRGEED